MNENKRLEDLRMFYKEAKEAYERALEAENQAAVKLNSAKSCLEYVEHKLKECEAGKRKKILITQAETAEEALSDLMGYQEIEPDAVIEEGSFCKLEEAADGRWLNVEESSHVELLNIISFDNELPDNMDGWYAARCAS